MENIYKVLPFKLAEIMHKKCNSEEITEIRLRNNRPAIIYEGRKEILLNYIVSKSDFTEILINISKNSIYAIQNEINEGFVIVKGGHRIGICGEAAMDGEKIINIKNINSMNVRVARQKIGCAKKIINYIVEGNEIKNTLIVSPPGMGKTTLLRDVARFLSDGIFELGFSGVNVGIVDERSEIAAAYLGDIALDVGVRTDVISNISKSKGIENIVRSMGLKVVITDEIGSKEDAKAIKYAVNSGVKCIFTMHGKDFDDILRNNQIGPLLEEGIFSNVIILSDKNGIGTIEKVHKIVPNKVKEAI